MKTICFFLIAFLSFFLFACKKENNQVPVKFYLTDAPADFDEVNVHITAIRVKLIEEEDNWVEVPTNAGIYNLLELQNGVTTLLAEGDLPQGEIKEIRFILGSNNSIKRNGNVYPLVIPSGAESGLKIKIGKKLQQALNTITLDFDAGLSVKEENNGYKLRPVIKLKG